MTTSIKGNATSTFGGQVVIPSPAFKLKKTSQQTVSNNTSTKITWDTAVFDLTSDTDLTNNRFTPSVEGYYQVNGLVRIVSLGDGDQTYLLLYKNGSEHKRLVQVKQGGSGSTNLGNSALVYMNGTTDYLELYARHDYGSDRQIAEDEEQVSFEGFLARAV